MASINPLRRARFEELLGRALGRQGAVIGLGQPGLALPTLGVAKTEPVGDQWRQQVREQAANAYAIVVSATPAALGLGLKWELDYLARAAPHGRIVLVLGPQSGRATPVQRFSTFLTITGCYDMFAPLGRAWVPDGTLVLVHVPADGSWHAWTARRRTAWTYTAAIDAAFVFAQREWSRPAQPTPAGDGPLVESVRLALDDAARTRLADSTVAEPADADPIDARHIMAALMRRHPQAQWNRVTPAGPNDLESTPAGDADPKPGGYWNGVPLTGTAHAAILSALRIARAYRMEPVPLGVLTLALATEAGSGAATAMTVHDGSIVASLSSSIQNDVLGTTLAGRSLPRTPQAVPAGRPRLRLRPATFVWSAIIASFFGFAPLNAATEEPLSAVIALVVFGLLLGPIVLWAVARSLSGLRHAWTFGIGGALVIVMLDVIAILRATAAG